jgi:hypothetical protein
MALRDTTKVPSGGCSDFSSSFTATTASGKSIPRPAPSHVSVSSHLSQVSHHSEQASAVQQSAAQSQSCGLSASSNTRQRVQDLERQLEIERKKRLDAQEALDSTSKELELMEQLLEVRQKQKTLGMPKTPPGPPPCALK